MLCLTMTPQEEKELQAHLEAAAAILFKNTPTEQLQDFERMERSVRDHVLAQVSPRIGNFLRSATRTSAGRKRQLHSCLGVLTVSQQQAKKLGLRARVRLSPLLEKAV